MPTPSSPASVSTSLTSRLHSEGTPNTVTIAATSSETCVGPVQDEPGCGKTFTGKTSPGYCAKCLLTWAAYKSNDIERHKRILVRYLLDITLFILWY